MTHWVHFTAEQLLIIANNTALNELNFLFISFSVFVHCCTGADLNTTSTTGIVHDLTSVYIAD